MILQRVLSVLPESSEGMHLESQNLKQIIFAEKR